MKISRRTRYGVRLMLELALHYGKKPLSISQIAQTEGISSKFLGQIIIPLKSAGLIQSTRGSRGGYELSRSPETINILDVFRVLEGDCLLTECIEIPKECTRSGTCIARNIWQGLTETIEEKLKAQDFKDLAAQARVLAEKQAPVYQI